jgi:hypothetical protein
MVFLFIGQPPKDFVGYLSACSFLSGNHPCGSAAGAREGEGQRERQAGTGEGMGTGSNGLDIRVGVHGVPAQCVCAVRAVSVPCLVTAAPRHQPHALQGMGGNKDITRLKKKACE